MRSDKYKHSSQGPEGRAGNQASGGPEDRAGNQVSGGPEGQAAQGSPASSAQAATAANAAQAATAANAAQTATATKAQAGRTKFGIFTRVWSIMYFFALVAFVVMLVYADILPAKIMYIALAIVGLISLAIFPTLYFYGFKRWKKIVALISSILLMGGFAFAIVNLGDTVGFFSQVTSVNEQTENYYVIVNKSSDYEKEDDIKGKEVATYLTNELNYSKAKGQLASDENVTYARVASLSKLGSGLLSKKYEAILISASHYKTICDQESDFKSKTRIIHVVKVKISSEDLSKNVDVTKESYNVYISGLDTSGTIDTASRSDVNMIVTVNPKTKTVLLTSIPRDYEIKLTSKDNATDKLTHTGIYGIQQTIKSVEKLTGVDMNYYLKVNYTTVTKFIDVVGGVDVNSDFTFTTHGQGVYYTFYEGKNHLDGAKALAFARERKSFASGDVQRNKDQAKIVEAVIKKASSSKTILTKYSSILAACKDYMEINMTSKEIKAIVKQQINDGGSWTIKKQNMTGSGTYETCYSTGDYSVYVMKPSEDQVVKAVDKIAAVMDGTLK